VLRILRCASAAILLLAVACNEHPVRDAKKLIRRTAEGPQILATVVTIRTTVQPGGKSTTSTIVIGTDVARDSAEIGTWRLFDLKNNRVAFVDDVAKTFRYVSLRALEQRHADAASGGLADGTPRAEYALTNERRAIAGVPATHAVVKLGAYQRELWIGSHPLIPPTLFALIHASQEPTIAAPIAAQVDSALLSARGFPLAEHAEVPYGKTKLVVDRQVVSVERKNVPESLLVIPPAYREVTTALPPVLVAHVSPPVHRVAPPPVRVAPPPPAAPTVTTAEGSGATQKPKAVVTKPAARHPAASSPPHDQKTPKAGSRSSAKGRKGL